jgi:uncharacterized protein YbaR (Trm112 family)
MLAKDLLDILACPRCKGELEYVVAAEKLICHACRLVYLIQDDIPIMLIEEAQPLDPPSPQGEGTEA